MNKIAFCESSGKHFNEDGEVVRGKVNPYDIGKYQINVLYWGEKAKELGHDVFTEEGNEAMAMEMYREQGTKPWSSSKPCWGSTVRS